MRAHSLVWLSVFALLFAACLSGSEPIAQTSEAETREYCETLCATASNVPCENLEKACGIGNPGKWAHLGVYTVNCKYAWSASCYRKPFGVELCVDQCVGNDATTPPPENDDPPPSETY